MQLNPWYLIDDIFGFEDPPDPDDGNDDDGDDGDDDDGDDGDDGDKGTESGKPPTPEDLNKLNEVVRKERKARREADREKRKVERELAELKEGKKDEDAEARAAAAEAKASSEGEKSTRLAARLRDTALENVVTKLATKMNFRDVDDALRLLDMADIDIDQDDEDPSDIDIDESTVEVALKKLGKSKPHLLKGDGDEEPSGGKFGGKKKGDNDQLTDEALAQKYPAIRGVPAKTS